ncbi:NRDE family protein [Simiduia curdlanivorans]|uniref:NRDE family protein n=1 Tax=Simiduia curdlanivorans TaxID=1492769 RepID=A0ABV8V0F4_9GAMM|nr:NRDE family protein [Simiduia curdlanivorans]MDN3637799.1 NRDE family protein [Simiduia curdlanivorans]
MCLLFIGHQAHAHWPLILASNRDEFHQRPTAAAHFWPEQPQWLGGKDLEAGGSWLLLNQRGRFGALTNVRNGQQTTGKLSRGELVKRAAAIDHAGAIDGREFGAFNLVTGALRGGHWQLEVRSNQSWPMPSSTLNAGVHGLSNASINTPWPKVASGRRELRQLLSSSGSEAELELGLWQLLGNRDPAPVTELPNTGIDRDMELLLSSRFIVNQRYGTRASTLLLVDRQQRALFIERSFDATGTQVGETRERFSFQL